MTIRRIGPLRAAAAALEALAVVGLPFVLINRQSALRFDVPSLTLHAFGAALRIDEFFLVLLAVLFLVFFFLWITLLFGRVWCGWACPQTVLSDLTAGLEAGRRASVWRRLAAFVLALALSVLAGANILWYFVSPYEFFAGLTGGGMGKVTAWSWGVLSTLVMLDLVLVRRTFCATVCPYARLQGAIFDSNTMVVGYDSERTDECMDCGACVRACPTAVDIREGASAACIACAACIDACGERLRNKGRPSLIAYVFGRPGASPRLARPLSLMVGAMALAFAALLAYAILTRAEIEMTVFPNPEFQARTVGGETVNSYILVFESRRSEESVALTLNAEGEGRTFEVRPGSIVLPAGARVKTAVFVSARTGESTMRAVRIAITAHPLGGGRPARGGITFRMPQSQR